MQLLMKVIGKRIMSEMKKMEKKKICCLPPHRLWLGGGLVLPLRLLLLLSRRGSRSRKRRRVSVPLRPGEGNLSPCLGVQELSV
jgi:hypothetical protein